MEFKHWLNENEKNEGIGSLIRNSAGAAAQLGMQFAGVPDPQELGLNLHGLGSTVNAAVQSSGVGNYLKQLSPEQIQFSTNNCYQKRYRKDCQLLCDKIRDKKACGMVGYQKVGRVWRQTNPMA
jgi:hypothetical protein